MDAATIAGMVGVASLNKDYTDNVGGSEEGVFASSYKTTFLNTPNDFIDYKNGPSITGGSIFLYVKDGNQNPACYIFNITGWNGTDDIKLNFLFKSDQKPFWLSCQRGSW